MDADVNTGSEFWVFGYGSLIWRPGFEFVESRIATVAGYQRSFCQASHDHRGTPDQPGRVVTLVPDHPPELSVRSSHDTNSVCKGVAFKLAEPVVEVLSVLDIREQDGYERVPLELVFEDGSRSEGLTWIAAIGNPSWRGGETIEDVARLISTREGPSGTNRDYLFELERALMSMDIEDAYIKELCFCVRAMP